MRYFIVVVMFLLMLSFASADLMRMSGSVTNSSGNVDGDIRFYIYDNETAGTLVYDSNSDFNDSIVNGSYDVLLGSNTSLDLIYGRIYYLDISINEEDLNFSGEDRQIFQSSVGDVIESQDSSNASGNYSLAYGTNASSSGTRSVAIGLNSLSNETQTISLGQLAWAIGYNSIAIGTTAQAYDSESIAIGRNSIAFERNSIALGYLTGALGENSVALGAQADATEYASIALGFSSDADGSGSIAVGVNSQTNDTDGIAIGNAANAFGGNSSIAIGASSVANDSSAIAIGEGANSEKEYSISMGYNSTSSGYHSIAIGTLAEAANSLGISLGFGSYSTTSGIAIGEYASTDSSGSVAVGESTNATGLNSIAIGRTAEATNSSAIAIGYASATGVGSLALGSNAVASGENSVAFDDVNVSGDHTVGIYLYNVLGGLNVHQDNAFVVYGETINFTNAGETTELCLNNDCISKWPSGNGSDSINYNLSSDNFTIISNNVFRGLYVADDDPADYYSMLGPGRMTIKTTGINYYPFINLEHDDYNWSLYMGGKEPYNNFYIAEKINNSNVNYFSIMNGSGNVGLGVEFPDEKLHVNGSVKVEDLLILEPTDAPGTCGASQKGSMYMDDSLSVPCFCNSTAWVRFEDSTVTC